MRFRYTAFDIDGGIVEGDTEAKNAAEVLTWMSSRSLKPISVKSLGGVDNGIFKGVLSQSINNTDKIFLTKYLSLMLKVGTDLFKAIDILITDFDKPSMKGLLTEVRDTLGKGQPFYITFAKYPKYFSQVFINLVKAGESSGTLDKVFEDLSKNLEKEQELKGKIKAALIYPVVLVVLSLLILFLMITFALPKIAETFLSAGIKPPLFSKIVFGVGLFLSKNILLVVLFIGSFVTFVWTFFFRTVVGSRIMMETFYRTPVIKDILYRLSIQRFASTLSSLLKSGMPIMQALEITADTVGSPEMRASLIRISRQGLAKGLTLGEAFRKESYFPRVIVNLVSISEKSGHLESILATLAEFYESEIDSSIKIMVSFLEPALLLVIGLIVAVIALSIIVPVYQLVGQI